MDKTKIKIVLQKCSGADVKGYGFEPMSSLAGKYHRSVFVTTLYTEYYKTFGLALIFLVKD